jgi:hypothetical protein
MIFSRCTRLCFAQSAQGSKARKEVSLRENCLRQMLHLQNEEGSE